jgi:hypothetical protein
MAKRYATSLDILNAQDLKREELEIPEWGDLTVIIQELSGKERMDLNTFTKSFGKTITPENQLLVIEKMVQICLVNPDGSKLLTEEQSKELINKSIDVLTRIINIASRLSGMSENALEEAKENLKKVQKDGSISI